MQNFSREPRNESGCGILVLVAVICAQPRSSFSEREPIMGQAMRRAGVPERGVLLTAYGMTEAQRCRSL